MAGTLLRCTLGFLYLILCTILNLSFNISVYCDAILTGLFWGGGGSPLVMLRSYSWFYAQESPLLVVFRGSCRMLGLKPGWIYARQAPYLCCIITLAQLKTAPPSPLSPICLTLSPICLKCLIPVLSLR